MTDNPLDPPAHKRFVLADIGNGGHRHVEFSALGGGEIMIMIDDDGRQLACVIVTVDAVLHGLVNLACFGGDDNAAD